ncbi:GrlR family regulatory protein [Rhodopseudomonas parapalustris]
MLLKGLYKVEFETPRRKGVGVVFASDSRLHGGSSAFAYIGAFEQSGQTIHGTITARRHTVDPAIQSVFGVDDVRVDFHGSSIGDFAQVEGIAAEAPSLGFKAVLTRISE